MFGSLTAWIDRRRILRDYAASEKAPPEMPVQALRSGLARAREALDRGDREAALTAWDDLRRLPAGQRHKNAMALTVMLDLGLFDEAAAAMRDGQRARRRDPFFAAGLAQTAHRRGDTAETLRLCADLRRRFPRRAEGYTLAAACLGSDQAAEAILDRAVRKLPNDLEIHATYARHAERRLDWAKALRRWEAANRRFDNPPCRGGIAQCLRGLGRFAEAAAMASETCRRFPEDPWAYAELAHIAAAEGNADRSLELWADARRAFPFFLPAFDAAADLAIQRGNLAAADAVLTAGVSRFRWNLDMHLAHARIAEQRGDRATASERWALAAARFPGQAAIQAPAA